MSLDFSSLGVSSSGTANNSPKIVKNMFQNKKFRDASFRDAMSWYHSRDLNILMFYSIKHFHRALLNAQYVAKIDFIIFDMLSVVTVLRYCL
jgi:hypothetical protein